MQEVQDAFARELKQTLGEQNKKEQIVDRCNNLQGPQENDAE